MSFEREDLRADIEKALTGVHGIKSVWSYRFKPFEPQDTPCANILPMVDEFDDTEMSQGFRRTETFRVEVLVARRTDDEDFAATCDRLYENSRLALMRMRPCKARCAKVKIVRKSWAVDSDSQVPVVVIKFALQIEFDESNHV